MLGNSAWARPAIEVSGRNSRAREEVVPWSMARMREDIGRLFRAVR